MPPIHKLILSSHEGLMVWLCEETPETLIKEVPEVREESWFKGKNPLRRKQRTVTRILVKRITSYPDIQIHYAPSGSPYLVRNGRILKEKVAISHDGDKVAVILRKAPILGVDIQKPRDKLEKIAHRFLHPGEKRWIQDLPAADRVPSLTLLWTAKEALYKAFGNVPEFSTRIRIDPQVPGDKGSVQGIVTPHDTRKERQVRLNYEWIHGHLLTWTNE